MMKTSLRVASIASLVSMLLAACGGDSSLGHSDDGIKGTAGTSVTTGAGGSSGTSGTGGSSGSTGTNGTGGSSDSTGTDGTGGTSNTSGTGSGGSPTAGTGGAPSTTATGSGGAGGTSTNTGGAAGDTGGSGGSGGKSDAGAPSDVCAATQCATGTHCVAHEVQCVRAPCPAQPTCVANTVACGGIANLPCANNKMCIDDPSDTCDPKNGGADCGGICVAKQNCAGVGDSPCPKGQVCNPDPAFKCDPKVTADCPTICVQGDACKTDQDCRLFDNYCGGCTCDAITSTLSDPACPTAPVQCLRAPCQGKAAKCVSNSCVVQ